MLEKRHGIMLAASLLATTACNGEKPDIDPNEFDPENPHGETGALGEHREGLLELEGDIASANDQRIFRQPTLTVAEADAAAWQMAARRPIPSQAPPTEIASETHATVPKTDLPPSTSTPLAVELDIDCGELVTVMINEGGPGVEDDESFQTCPGNATAIAVSSAATQSVLESFSGEVAVAGPIETIDTSSRSGVIFDSPVVASPTSPDSHSLENPVRAAELVTPTTPPSQIGPRPDDGMENLQPGGEYDPLIPAVLVLGGLGVLIGAYHVYDRTTANDELRRQIAEYFGDHFPGIDLSKVQELSPTEFRDLGGHDRTTGPPPQLLDQRDPNIITDFDIEEDR